MFKRNSIAIFAYLNFFNLKAAAFANLAAKSGGLSRRVTAGSDGQILKMYSDLIEATRDIIAVDNKVGQPPSFLLSL